MTELRGKVVAVTGAASGIGRALAQELFGRGARVAISDVNEAGLSETARLLGGGSAVSTHLVDVRERAAMERYAAEVEAAHGGADVIINNAGAAARATIEDMSYEDFAFVIDVNLWGVVHGVKSFMPLLRKRKEGHIVNISSINAMVPFAKNGPYNAAKYAVLGLSETLMQELVGSAIHVTCVHPGGIQTNIARSARGVTTAEADLFGRVAKTSPRAAAQVILDAVERNRAQVFVGLDAKLMGLAKRLVPRWIVRAAGRATYEVPRGFGLTYERARRERPAGTYRASAERRG